MIAVGIFLPLAHSVAEKASKGRERRAGAANERCKLILQRTCELDFKAIIWRNCFDNFDLVLIHELRDFKLRITNLVQAFRLWNRFALDEARQSVLQHLHKVLTISKRIAQLQNRGRNPIVCKVHVFNVDVESFSEALISCEDDALVITREKLDFSLSIALCFHLSFPAGAGDVNPLFAFLRLALAVWVAHLGAPVTTLHLQTTFLPATTIFIGFAIFIIARASVTGLFARVNPTHPQSTAFLIASRIYSTTHAAHLLVSAGAPFCDENGARRAVAKVAFFGARVAAWARFGAGKSAVRLNATASNWPGVKPSAARAGDAFAQRNRARRTTTRVTKRIAGMSTARKYLVTQKRAQMPLVVLHSPPHTTNFLTSMSFARHRGSAFIVASQNDAINRGCFSLRDFTAD